MSIRKAFYVGLLALAPALTGCLVHTHSVLRTRPPTIVLGTTLDQLLKQVDDRDNTIHSMTAAVEVIPCTGGSSKGEVRCYASTSGYIIIQKPEQISVILKVPLLGSRALDMVSNGKTFKLLIPPESCAIYGSDVVNNTAQKGLYALRPAVILDSLMIHGLQPGQVVSMTQGDRIVPDPKTRKDVIDEPTYNLQFLLRPTDHTARALRVIHVSRTDLLPFQQDIYNADGKIETTATYSNYQKFGDIVFPKTIRIERPLDELTLTITILPRETSFNQQIPPDQFTLDLPPSTAHMVNMDDPATASITNPCGVRATQSQH